MEASIAHSDTAHEHETSFIRKYVFSLDHKVIAIQYLLTGLFYLLAGGVMALLIRWQLAYPNEAVPIFGKVLFPGAGGAINPEVYNSLFTLHGTIMVFFRSPPS